MKKFIKISFLLLVVSLFAANTGFSQKYAYLNSGNLLEKMPERVAADKQLEAFQDPLIKEGESKVAALETQVEQFYKDVESGTLSQVVIQQRQTELQAEQDKIAAYEKEVQDKIVKKRQELLEPILNKVQAAIEAVAKEGNYTMIFDSSLFNVLLFAAETDDLTTVVEKKLGI